MSLSDVGSSRIILCPPHLISTFSVLSVDYECIDVGSSRIMSYPPHLISTFSVLSVDYEPI